MSRGRKHTPASPGGTDDVKQRFRGRKGVEKKKGKRKEIGVL